MRTEWGRTKSTDGPSIHPVYTYALVLLSLVVTLGIEGFRYMRVWTPLQRHYLHAYLGSQIAGAVRDNGWYTLLNVATRNGSRLALDSDVVLTVTKAGRTPLHLPRKP